MSRKFYIPLICLVSLCMVFAFSMASADTGVEILIYTGKIAVTSQNQATTTYTIPQEVTALSTDTIIEVIDGVAILKVGEVQVVMESTDKLQVIKKGETVDMVCLSGDVEALYGDDLFKMALGQTLALDSQGTPAVETAKTGDTKIRPEIGRAKLSSPAVMTADPEEPKYTSPSF